MYKNLKVEVYSKYGCQQCKMVKKWLIDHKIDFVEKNVDDSQEYLNEVKQMYLSTVPVTKIKKGNDPEEILVLGFAPNLLHHHLEE